VGVFLWARHPFNSKISSSCTCPSEYGTHKTVTARFWRSRSGKSPYNVSSCSLFARQRKQEQPLRRNVKRFRGGLVFKAHRRLYHSTLGLSVIKKEKRKQVDVRGIHFEDQHLSSTQESRVDLTTEPRAEISPQTASSVKFRFKDFRAKPSRNCLVYGTWRST